MYDRDEDQEQIRGQPRRDGPRGMAAALRESEHRYRQLFEEASDGIFVTSRDGQLLDANPSGLAILGLEQADLQAGVDIRDFYADPADRVAFTQAMEQARDGAVRDVELRLRRRDGTEAVLLVSASLRRDTAGRIIGYQGFGRDITARRRAEDALRAILVGTASQSGVPFFQQLVRHLAAALGVRWAVVADIRGDRARTLGVWAGQELGEDFEYELAGTPCEDVATQGVCLYHADVQQTFPSDHLLQTMGVRSYVGTPLRNGSDEPLGLLVGMHDQEMSNPKLARDILQIFAARAGAELARMRSEAQLREREAAYRLDFENVSDIVFSLDPQGTLLSVSPSVERALGYRPDELVGRPMAELGVMTLESLARSIQSLQRLNMGESTQPQIYEFIARDGSRVHGELMSSAVMQDGKAVRFISVARNVTDRVVAERKLRESEQINRYTFEQAAVGILAAAPESCRLIRANRRACELLGYSEEELLERTCSDLTHPDDRRDTSASLARLHAGEVPGFGLEKRYVRKDGSTMTAHVTVSLVRDADGKPLQVIAVLEDVTARKESERQLARLAAAVTHAAEDILITDVEGRIRYVNPAFERVTGYTLAEVRGRTPRFLRCTPYERSSRGSMLRVLQDGGVWSSRVRTRRKDGSYLDQDVTVTAIHDANGTQLGHVAVRRDVTEQLQLEAQVRQVQKLEAIGTLAGGIAHDFNNMLAPIIGYTDMTLEQLEPGTQLYKYQDRVAQAARRASDLVRQILTFSRHTEQERQPVQLTPLLKEFLKLMRASLPTTIRIKTRIGADRGMVLADPTQMHQVLMNLCANAAHAMRAAGGVLELELETVDVDKTLAHKLPGLAAGPHVRITVRDDGHGMDSETLGRAFEPFFTTKAKEEGTGLGLSVVHGIVTSHAGAITADSEPGGGTTFRVYLPRHPASEEATSSAEEPIRGGSERILLVDDEPQIAEFARLALVRLGYQVQAFSTAREALQAFRRQPEHFDLVLTDLTMPQMTGLQLAQAIRGIRPHVPVIVTTGSSSRNVQAALDSRAICGVIQKPAGLRHLARSVRDCLDEV